MWTFDNLYVFLEWILWRNGLVVKALDTKPLGGSKVGPAFHPSQVHKVSTRKLWELSGKK